MDKSIILLMFAILYQILANTEEKNSYFKIGYRIIAFILIIIATVLTLKTI